MMKHYLQKGPLPELNDPAVRHGDPSTLPVFIITAQHAFDWRYPPLATIFLNC